MSEKLGRYELLEEIGQGGFAIVYRARDTELDRLVALKELRLLLLGDRDWVRRFRREARAIARLDHPRIIPIYDVGHFQERHFIVMRLVDGPGLDKVIAGQGRLPWPETVNIITAVAEGLDYAHTRGILHRDLKPGNIMLDPERGPLLTDFGFAKLVGENSMSLSGDIMGTPHYIAPEAWEGQQAGPQVDVYALGCILWEMLTGEKLFKGGSPPAVMMAHFKPLDLPERWPPGVPPGVADVLAAALAQKPEKRYATAGEMAEALAALRPDEAGRPDRSSRKTRSLEDAAPQKAAPQQVKRDGRREPSTGERTGQVPDPTAARPESTGEGSQPQSSQQHKPGLTGRPAISGSRASAQAADSGPARRDDENLSEKWRGFLAHLGPYVMVIGFLGLINLFTSDYPWVIWPALGWGVGLAFHLMSIGLDSLKGMSEKWHGFLSHLGSYLIIIGMLAMINLFTSSSIWFHWPALGWGVAVVIHLWTAIIGTEDEEEEADSHQQAAAERVEAVAEAPASTGQDQISNRAIQGHLDKARSYKEQIDSLIKTTADHKVHVRLQDLAAQMNEWIEAITELARRVDSFQRDSLIHQDLESVPRSIEKLEAELAVETDEATRAELERTLANRRNQLAALVRLQNTMKRAEFKIESTLSALGTIYPQLLTSQSTDQVAGYARLSADLDEEVRTLQDHLEALEEVKMGRLSS